MILKLDMVQTASLAVIVLFVGQKIKNKVPYLEKYCIPSPVIGGLIFAFLTLALKVGNVLTLDMDITLQKLFMTAFFTTIGFTAGFKLLKTGGKAVFIFLGLNIILCFAQNILGVSLAKMFGLHPLIGLATGSTPLVGGLGTAGAFAPLFEKAGAVGANTVAIASATFGLVVGSLIGGPLAKRLIEKNNLKTPMETINSSSDEVAAEMTTKQLIPENFMNAVSQILLAMGIGTIISFLLEKTGMTFPVYIGAMFAAAIIRNISDATHAYKFYGEEIDIVGDIALALFLAMALMGLKLWQLASLALPLIVMLSAQAVLITIFAYFVIFYIMGKDYEASVIASGEIGFGLGATANAMANMNALSSRYGHAPKAFFIVPLVGSLFIDFFNAGIITGFMNFFK